MAKGDTVKKTGNNLFTGQPGPGRPKGVRNKLTMQAKEAIALAADRLGGVDRLVLWAQEDPKNETVFWSSIYPRLVPLDVNGNHNVNIVDRAELLQRARDEVREIFGDRGAGESFGVSGGSMPH